MDMKKAQTDPAHLVDDLQGPKRGSVKPPRHKKATTLRAVLANLVRDLRVWWGK